MQVLAVVEEPLHALREARQPVEHVLRQHLDGAQGDQTDQRADPQGHGAPFDVELIVVEAVLLVPQPGAAQTVHRVRDGDEVLEELRREVLVGAVLPGQLHRHGQQRGAVEGHPRRPVRLLEEAARRQRPRAVEDADVVEAEEPAREQMVALGVLAIHPPGEVEQQLLEDPREEESVARSPPGRSSCRRASRPRREPAG